MNEQVLQQCVIWTSCSFRIMHTYAFSVSKAANSHAYLVTVALLVAVCMLYNFCEINFRLLKAQGLKDKFQNDMHLSFTKS